MEAGRAVQRGLVTPDKTTFIVSTNRVYAMTEKIALADGRVDSPALLEACRTTAKRLIHGDMAQLAESTGSVISSVLFGALAGANVLPMQRMAFEAAIRRGGVGVKESLAAFGAGFAAATDGVPAKASEPIVSHVSPALAPLMAEVGAYHGTGTHVYPRRYRTDRRLSGCRLRARIPRPTEAGHRGRAQAWQRLGAAARRNRPRTGARHGLRGHRARRRTQDPAGPIRTRSRGGSARRRADPGDRRVPASASAGDRRHAAGRPRPLAAQQRLAAPAAGALHKEGQGAEDVEHPRLPPALLCRLAQTDTPPLAAVPERARLSRRLAQDNPRRGADQLRAGNRDRADAHAW